MDKQTIDKIVEVLEGQVEIWDRRIDNDLDYAERNRDDVFASAIRTGMANGRQYSMDDLKAIILMLKKWGHDGD